MSLISDVQIVINSKKIEKVKNSISNTVFEILLAFGAKIKMDKIALKNVSGTLKNKTKGCEHNEAY